MAFYPVEIDVCPAYGWTGGPSVVVDIKKLRNRHEKRNAPNQLIERRYILPFQNVHDDEYLEGITALFISMYGPLHSFLAKDFSDFQALNESLGNAPSGSTPVQLIKSYSVPNGPVHTRDITHPTAGAVIYQAGVPKAGTYSQTTGLFTPSTAWTLGEPLTWTGQFRVNVRLESLYLPASIDNRNPGGRYLMNGSAELVEVFSE